MCLGVEFDTPGDCPKCGMRLERIFAYSYVNLPAQFKPGDHFHPSELHVVDEATREQELLGANQIEFDDNAFALIKRHERGLISTVVLGKCCNVEPHMLPINDL